MLCLLGRWWAVNEATRDVYVLSGLQVKPSIAWVFCLYGSDAATLEPKFNLATWVVMDDDVVVFNLAFVNGRLVSSTNKSCVLEGPSVMDLQIFKVGRSG